MPSLNSFRSVAEEMPRLSDFVDVLKKDKMTGDGIRVRLIGPCYRYKIHNIKGQSKTRKDFFYSIPCPDYNCETDGKNGVECPYCKAKVPAGLRLLVNAILLDNVNLSMMNPENFNESEREVVEFEGLKFRCKDLHSNSYTPAVVLDLPNGMVSKLQALANTNYVKDSEGHRTYYELTDLKFGCNLLITFNPKASTPNEKYSVVLDPESDKRSAIDPELRKRLLIWNIPEAVKKTFMPIDALEEKIRRDAERIQNADNIQIYLPEGATPKVNTDDLDMEEPQPRKIGAKKSIPSLDADEDEMDVSTPGKVVEADDLDDLPF